MSNLEEYEQSSILMQQQLINESTSLDKNVKIIQQWQAFGRVHPSLLENDVYIQVRNYGITSLQSYVYWAEIEKKRNEWDFSVYDEVAEKIAGHDLKWCPFLILGTNYSVPQWFHNNEHSVYAKCVEHGRECDIQSIWNPFILEYVDEFIARFSKRYNNDSLIEGVLLGVSGVWGEAIYPAGGGVYRKGHRHCGWWCNDEYARKDFIEFCKTDYKSLDELNKSWGTCFNTYSDIEFPVRTIALSMDILIKGLRRIWRKILNDESSLFNYLETIHEEFCIKSNIGIEQGKNRFLFFARWYMGSMTKYAEKWIQTAKKYFFHTPIYLVAGGYGEVISGADFVKQIKTCSRHKCGMRITNLVGTYAQSFVNKSLVSTAAEHYEVDVQTEETIETSPDEVNVRIFDYCTSKSTDGMYFKTLFGVDYGTVVSCTGKRDNGLFIGMPSGVAKKFLESRKWLISGPRKVDVAFLVSNNSLSLHPHLLNVNFRAAKRLRSFFDLDIIDENLIEDDILKNYRICISFNNPEIPNSILNKIGNWCRDGGLFVCSDSDDCKLINFPDNADQFKKACEPNYGHVYNIKEQNAEKFADSAAELLCDPVEFPWDPLYPHKKLSDGVYFSKVGDKLVVYNDTSLNWQKEIFVNENKTLNCSIDPKSIKILSLED